MCEYKRNTTICLENICYSLSSDMLLKATKELDKTKSELSGLVNEEAKRNRFAKAGEYYVLCIS